MSKKAVFFFCVREPFHYVARGVFERLKEELPLDETSMEIDGYPVLQYEDACGDQFLFCRQNALISYEFERYLPTLRECFVDADVAIEVNWHEGDKAPDKILTVHTIGDVERGIFSPADSRLVKGLVTALEKERLKAGLEEFSVMTEGTHWTGSYKGQDPELLKEFPVPMVDLEIGSAPSSWDHKEAICALARGLLGVFSWKDPLVDVLCVGGVHFERAFSDVTIDSNMHIGISHILPNHWLVSGAYDDEKEGPLKLKAALNSIRGNVRAIVYHEGIKSSIKRACRQLAEEEGIPALRHKKLKDPEVLNVIL